MFDIKLVNDSLIGLEIKKLDRNVYLECLQSGGISVTDLAKKQGVERRTVYSALDRLREVGLLKLGREKYNRAVVVEPPSKLLELLERKKNGLSYNCYQLESNMSFLMAKYAENSPLSSLKISEGRKKFLECLDSLLSQEAEVIFYGDYVGFVEMAGSEYELQWWRKCERKGIKGRVLSLGGGSDFKGEKYNCLVRRIRESKGEIGFFMACGMKILIWNQAAKRGFMLEDELLDNMLKRLFEASWLVASE